MPRKSRDLTVEDVARIVAINASTSDSDTVYRAVEAAAAETVGFVFLTILKQDDAEQAVVRVHSSNQDAYPVGGKKPYATIQPSQDALKEGRSFSRPTAPP